MDAKLLKPEILQQSLFLSSLPANQLSWLIQNSEIVSVEKGETIIHYNVPQDAFYVILEGEFEISRGSDQEKVVLAVQGRGQIVGEMSALGDVPPTASVTATCPSQMLKIRQKTFNQLILGNPATALQLVRTSLVRARDTEVMLNQREKLASLGTLAAGLAHELNNPVAAARSSSEQLRKTINTWLNSRVGLDALNLEASQNDIVMKQLRENISTHDQDRLSMDPLERSDREGEIEAWLETLGMQDAWGYVPSLVAFDWRQPELAAWCAQFDPTQVPVILRWLATGYTVHTLVDEILESSERISEIVSAVKSYTYMDEAPKKEIDIHEGLESTLVMLRHKIKQGITIERSYNRALPRIEAYGSELNQVWTNLIDNAIQAMNGEGVLHILTYAKDDCLVVEIDDNGAGIPSAVLPHIFEPFYTTKEPGKGTGLGLHVSYLIVQKHSGKIEVKSQPGDTRFFVRLPFHRPPHAER